MKLRAAILPLLALTLVAGCQRKPRFVPPEGESAVQLVDSLQVRTREAQRQWELTGSREAAASSARVLADWLAHFPPQSWKSEADALLDSLGIGAESAEAPCALGVNFFSRADPTAGSWPYLFWCGGQSPRFQEIEGRDLQLLRLATRGLGGAGQTAGGEARGAALLFGRRSAGGHQPLLMVLGSPPGGERWRMVQMLGPDSLGGFGEGEFEIAPDSGIELTTRTYQAHRHFDECGNCPHVYWLHRFRWGTTGFERLADRIEPSPYSTFVRLVEALLAGHDDAALSLVAHSSLIDTARRLEWQTPKGRWRAAPGADGSARVIEFYRGQEEAFRVRFEPWGEEWRVAGIEPMPRIVE